MKTMTALAMGCALTAGSMFAAGFASAQPGPRQGPGAGDRPGPPREFSLTYEQAKERWPNLTQERFDEMDTDGDGVLTPADRMGRPGPRGEGDTNPRGERRPRDGRGPAPAE